VEAFHDRSANGAKSGSHLKSSKPGKQYWRSCCGTAPTDLTAYCFAPSKDPEVCAQEATAPQFRYVDLVPGLRRGRN
jgi:hypothetical protein